MSDVNKQNGLPIGWRMVLVNEGFDSLMFWLDRCDQKGHLENCFDLVEPYAAFKYEEIPQAVGDAWIEASAEVPLEGDGEVFVRFTDGSIGTAWATYWHGASNKFAQWSFPDPDEDREVDLWMKPPAVNAGAKP